MNDTANDCLRDRVLATHLMVLGHRRKLRAGRAVVYRGRHSFVILGPDGSTRIMRVGHRLGECRNWLSAAEWVVNELNWWGWL